MGCRTDTNRQNPTSLHDSRLTRASSGSQTIIWPTSQGVSPKSSFMLTLPSINEPFLVTTPHLTFISTYPQMCDTFQEGATLTTATVIQHSLYTRHCPTRFIHIMSPYPHKPCALQAIIIPMLQTREQNLGDLPKVTQCSKATSQGKTLWLHMTLITDQLGLKSAPTENWIHSQMPGFFLKQHCLQQSTLGSIKK